MFSGGDGRQALGKQGRTARRWHAHAVVRAARAGDRWPASIGRWIGSLDAADLNAVTLNRDLMLRRASVAANVLRQRSFAALVLSEDNVELDTAVWIAVARNLGIRSVIVPYTISNTAEFLESYVRHQPYQVSASRLNGLIARWFPQWTARHAGRYFVRSTPAKVLAAELLGLAPPNPWLLNSGHVDAIAVESSAMREYYLSAGIPARQLSAVGSLTDDVLAEGLRDAAARRASLEQELGLTAGRPLLLAALPPDQNTYDRPACEFSGFDDLIGFWGSTLAGLPGWNVVVRPHPKTRPERLGALRRHGVAISYDDTAGLIPPCDVYVAAVSATIRWAIACGKPVVNYDVYQYGYRDYERVEGVVLVNTRKDFVELVGRVTTDADYRAGLAGQQSQAAPDWAMLDGASGQRMIELLRGADVRPSLRPSTIAVTNRTSHR
jgi:hypothetical protein